MWSEFQSAKKGSSQSCKELKMSILLETSAIHLLQTSFASMILTNKHYYRIKQILSNSHKVSRSSTYAQRNKSNDEKHNFMSKTSHHFCNCCDFLVGGDIFHSFQTIEVYLK